MACSTKLPPPHFRSSHHAPVLITAFLLSTLPVVAQQNAPVERLAAIMEGSYSSAEQARTDTSYFDIELEMKRIWRERTDGVWLYVEQAAADSKAKPYRQRVYHLHQLDDSTFTSDIHTIKGGEQFFGAYMDAPKLAALQPDSLALLEGCTITLHLRGDAYVGSTNGQDCPNTRAGAAYATSEVVLGPDRMVSWDRGYSEAGEQVWGAEKGGYVFVKNAEP